MSLAKKQSDVNGGILDVLDTLINKVNQLDDKLDTIESRISDIDSDTSG